MSALLRAEGLTKHFHTNNSLLIPREASVVRAVDGVDLTLGRGETLGLVGESGSGKSTLGRLLARLLVPTSGRIEFEGTEISALSDRGFRPFRRDIQMIFQDPYSSLNPRHTVGAIIGTAFRLQRSRQRQEIKPAVQELLEIVGLSPEHYNRYPHEFSGGQRQRIGIARALALRPKLIICDEPVSALDVSIQAQIINLLSDLQDEFGLSYLFISHDLSVVRHICDRIAVMYLGKLVEVADADTLYEKPQHPYTNALLSAVPVPDPDVHRVGSRIPLGGDVPSPLNPPTACRFHTRCPKAQPVCATDEPLLEASSAGHLRACHFPENE